MGGAFIFSGRPDPTWRVEEQVRADLERIWASLDPCERAHPVAPPLGYRGCFLRCGPDVEWFAYGGVVTLKRAEGHESRLDSARHFERTVLQSAPDGLMPVDQIL